MPEYRDTRPSAAPTRPVLWLAVAAWLAVIGGGLFIQARYEVTPGPSGEACSSWPPGTGLARARNVPALVMFAHPRCPCTRASIEALGGALARSGRPLDVWIVFFAPHNPGPEWTDTALTRRARCIALPSTGGSTPSVVKALFDEGGAEAHRFGAETSGDVMAFDASGILRFHGGITPARGQTGASAGLAAVAAFLLGQEPGLREAPVFGCGLLTTEDACASTVNCEP